jgi:hypothetical protein
LFNVTVTLLITTPEWPEMVNGDGYGLAAPLELIVTAVGLHPLMQSPVIVTVKPQLPPPAELVQATEVVPIGKKAPDGGEQLIVPQVPVDVGAG